MKIKKISIAIAGLASLLLINCTGAGNSEENEANTSIKFLSKETLGESLFFDTNLSLTRKTSCATCHDPNHAFIDTRFSKEGTDQSVFINGAFSVGDDGFSLGGRNAPTASYAKFAPNFNANTLIGGQFHDGRASDLQAQAEGPPLDAAEMQMPNKMAVIERIQENKDYIASFKFLYSDDIFDDVNKSYQAMSEAIAKFEKTDKFSPFDSKYDRMKRGEYTFNRDEDGGYALFFSNTNTNCATCHSLDSKGEASINEMFTNYEYENIGVPRNIEAMNARVALGLQEDSATFDGVGASVDNDVHLGKTKVPTLRNIAVTAPYMNNGKFMKLRTVLEFYDHMAGLGHHINPEIGEVWGDNDHNATINFDVLTTTKELSNTKIRQIEAFLRTLTDKKYEHLLPKLAPEGELGN